MLRCLSLKHSFFVFCASLPSPHKHSHQCMPRLFKLLRWFGVLDSDICTLELFTISNFKVERFSCNVPIPDFSAWDICLSQASEDWAITALWRWVTAVGGCSDDVKWWGNYAVMQAAPRAWQTVRLWWPLPQGTLSWFSLLRAMGTQKIPRILEWEGRALKRICFLFAVLYVPVMLKRRWKQILPVSCSGGKKPCQAAFGKEASKAWPMLP